MHGAMILSIIFGGVVLGLAIIGSTILIGLKIIKGGVSRKDQRNEAEEARMIQEIYHGLAEMEKRVESLETIVLEKERKDRER